MDLCVWQKGKVAGAFDGARQRMLAAEARAGLSARFYLPAAIDEEAEPRDVLVVHAVLVSWTAHRLLADPAGAPAARPTLPAPLLTRRLVVSWPLSGRRHR
jgi:hypothetical protein